MMSFELDTTEFVRGITFRNVQPMMNIVFSGTPHQARSEFEQANTRLPEDQEYYNNLLGGLWAIPRMSTFAIAALINRIVAKLPRGMAYVNVGVWHGYTFLAGMLGNPDSLCIGIDNFSEFGGPADDFMKRYDMVRSQSHRFFEMDFRAYFSENHKAPIGLYFYDGAHDYNSQYEGLVTAEQFIANGGYILVDDTNWEAPYRATLDFVAQRPGQYQVILDQNTAYNGHPTWWNGVLVLRKY